MTIPEEHRERAVVALGLVVLVGIAYRHVPGFDFVNLDDPFYVYENPAVRAGLGLDGITWAFTTLHEGGWRPLVWLSFMLDTTLFGTDPFGYHLSNVLLHAANAVLLAEVLRRLTGQPRPAAWVALLFALHPQHVEAVAWITSRKDVLSTLFFMLALLSYARALALTGRPRIAPVAIWFTLGLMAKPMLVTLPLVLLLLDGWPLARLGRDTWAACLWEKLPLFAIALVFGVLAVLGQDASRALWSMEQLSFPARIANALVSYVAYLGDFFWPVDLIVPHPFPSEGLAPGHILLCTLLLVAISGVALWIAGRAPYVPMGWLWYLVTLLPVSGLLQFGMHARADRFTYIPTIGLCIALVWGIRALLAARELPQSVQGMSALPVLVLGWATGLQLSHWQDAQSLHRHVLSVQPDHVEAHHGLGMALGNAGELGAALPHLEEAVRLAPAHPEARADLGVLLALRGDTRRGARELREAARLAPTDAGVRHKLATTLANAGETEAALQELRAVIRIDPERASAHNDLGVLLATAGDLAAALPHLREAARLGRCRRPRQPEGRPGGRRRTLEHL